VGDIKPAEAEIQFFMDLAWDINAWKPAQAINYTEQWAKNIFGASLAPAIAFIKNKYYELAASGKPEHLSKIQFTEAAWNNRLAHYQSIAQQARALYNMVTPELKDAFYQLVLYPVVSANLMNEKFAYAQKSISLAKQGNKEALLFAAKSKAAFDSIGLLTEKYNKEIANGKWNGMMSWHPRNLDVFKMPSIATEAMVNEFAVKPLQQSVSDTIFITYLSAGSFVSEHNRDEAEIIKLPGVGDDANSLTLLPYSFQIFKTKDKIEYPAANLAVKLTKGRYLLRLHTLPSHALNESMTFYIGVRIGNISSNIFNVEVAAETPEWDKAVVNGYVQRDIPFELINEQSVNIKLLFPSGGVVVSKIALYSIK